MLTMDSAGMARFDQVCQVLSARGRGLTLAQLGNAMALAEEEGRATPDPERCESLRDRLDITAAEPG